MSEPGLGTGRRARALSTRFTAVQFVVFLCAGLVGLAALLAAGLAVGVALAGAGFLAVTVLAVWFITANLVGGERPARGPRSQR